MCAVRGATPPAPGRDHGILESECHKHPNSKAAASKRTVQEPEGGGQTVGRRSWSCKVVYAVEPQMPPAMKPASKHGQEHLLPVDRVLALVLVAVVPQVHAAPEEPRDDPAERGCHKYPNSKAAASKRTNRYRAWPILTMRPGMMKPAETGPRMK